MFCYQNQFLSVQVHIWTHLKRGVQKLKVNIKEEFGEINMIFYSSRKTGRNAPLYQCMGANKGDISVCFVLLWKDPFVWLCPLLSRKPTFPGVLFMLIVLFLPLSSSHFWPQTQSSKCGQPHMFESSLFTSLFFRLSVCSVPSLCLFRLCASQSLVWIVSPVLDLFCCSSLEAMKQLLGKMR